MTCRNASAQSAESPQPLQSAMLDSAKTVLAWPCYPTAQITKPTHLIDAMGLAESRARRLYPHSPRKQRRYMQRIKETFSDD